MIYPKKTPWLISPKPKPSAALRLICFPYAGGAASAYLPWVDHLGPDVELLAVQLPGRANRMSEPPFRDMSALIAALHTEIRPWLDKPYVLFGHSLGSRIGFELMRRIEAGKGRLPCHFVASASAAPHRLVRQDMIHEQADDELICSLRRLNGTPESLLQNRDLMSLLMPVLRADFKLAETYYCPLGSRKMPCELSLFSGSDDGDVREDDLLAWSDHFCSEGELTQFQGGHMFIEQDRERVVAQVNTIVEKYCAQFRKVAALG